MSLFNCTALHYKPVQYNVINFHISLNRTLVDKTSLQEWINILTIEMGLPLHANHFLQRVAFLIVLFGGYHGRVTRHFCFRPIYHRCFNDYIRRQTILIVSFL
jgi:hypothetical protein